MRAEELRIGNYLFPLQSRWPGSKHIVVYDLSFDDVLKQVVVNSSSDGLCVDDEVEPIPLTEDWLKRFGFIEPDGRDGYGGLLSPLFNGSRIRVKDNSWMCYESTVRLDYVHQLQNLYFALTGTELKLN